MRVVNDWPPNIEQIRARFQLRSGFVFTYGDTLYNPDNALVDDSLIAHEETHTRQQDDDPFIWWHKYLNDDKFRLEQEIEAYRNQYRSEKKKVKDRNRLNWYLRALAKDLSSEVYGSIISFSEAMQKIKE